MIEKYPDFKLVIIGDGPDLDKLKNLSKEINISNNVVFVGKIALNNMPLYYQLGDIFVTASKSETQGLTVVEAMSSSIPVVAVNDESFKNSVIDDFNGYLFDTDEEYIEYITTLYEDKHLYGMLSRQARILSNDFSSEFLASKVLKVYETAIKNYNINNKKLSTRIKRIIEKRKFKV